MTQFKKWTGGTCPVSPEVVVTVCFASDETNTKTRNAEDFRWEWVANGKGGDITGYYVGLPS